MGPPSKMVLTKAAFHCCLKTVPGRPGIISYCDGIMGFKAELIFVTNITNYVCWEKSVMWRNFRFLWRIWTIYGVLSKFMRFLFQISVEINLRGENLCGEKMTNMRSATPLDRPSQIGPHHTNGLFISSLSRKLGHFPKLRRIWCSGRENNLDAIWVKSDA